MGSYAAHSTVLPAANLEFSGDYPGYWSLAVERATAGMALFLAGGMGSHGPRAGAPSFEPRTMSFFGPQLPECFIAVLGELTAVLADR